MKKRFLKEEIGHIDLSRRIAENTGLTFKEAEFFTKEFINALIEASEDKDVLQINLPDFGRFKIYNVPSMVYPSLTEGGAQRWSKPTVRLQFAQFKVAKNKMKSKRLKLAK
ncbi:MAG: hypothetical protein ACRC6V_06925 [Bacteroidales bacterium]